MAPTKASKTTSSNVTMSIAGMVAKGLTTEQFTRKYGHLLAGIQSELTAQLTALGCWDIYIHPTYTMYNNPDAYGFMVRFQTNGDVNLLALEGFTWKASPWWNKDYWVWNVRKQVGI